MHHDDENKAEQELIVAAKALQNASDKINSQLFELQELLRKLDERTKDPDRASDQVNGQVG